MTWSSTAAIDILNFCRENTPSVLVLPPQACLHLFRDIIVTTSFTKLFFQRVIQSIFIFLSLREIIRWLLILWDWLCPYGHLVCLVGFRSRHFHFTSLRWCRSFMLRVVKLFVALNGLVDIRLVILQGIQFFPLLRLWISFHLVKFDDFGLILRMFMLLEWTIVDLIIAVFLLKLLHLLIAHEMRVFDNAVCVDFRLSVLFFYGSELLVEDNRPNFMIIWAWFHLDNMADGTVRALRRALDRKSMLYVLELMFARQFAYDLFVFKPLCFLITIR